jgi:hypothetical protein
MITSVDVYSHHCVIKVWKRVVTLSVLSINGSPWRTGKYAVVWGHDFKSQLTQLLLELQRDLFLALYNSPHWSMVTGSLGLFCAPVGTFSIFLTTRMDSSSMHLPKTTCFSSSQSHLAHVIKNWPASRTKEKQTNKELENLQRYSIWISEPTTRI